MTTAETRSTASRVRVLRDKLKEFGLERTVQLMTVEERGDARRLIRDALKYHADFLDGARDDE